MAGLLSDTDTRRRVYEAISNQERREVFFAILRLNLCNNNRGGIDYHPSFSEIKDQFTELEVGEVKDHINKLSQAGLIIRITDLSPGDDKYEKSIFKARYRINDVLLLETRREMLGTLLSQD
jgi:hypothetical protein